MMSFLIGCSQSEKTNAEFEIGGYPINQVRLVLIPEGYLEEMQARYGFADSLVASSGVQDHVSLEMVFRIPIIVLSERATQAMFCDCLTEEVLTEDDMALSEISLSSSQFLDVDIMSLESPVAFYLANDGVVFGFHTLQFGSESQDTEQEEKTETAKETFI